MNSMALVTSCLLTQFVLIAVWTREPFTVLRNVFRLRPCLLRVSHVAAREPVYSRRVKWRGNS